MEKLIEGKIALLTVNDKITIIYNRSVFEEMTINTISDTTITLGGGKGYTCYKSDIFLKNNVLCALFLNLWYEFKNGYKQIKELKMNE